MDKVKILERELKALGQRYRNDWSDFDGRSLKRQIEYIFEWFNDESKQEEFTDFTDLLKEQAN